MFPTHIDNVIRSTYMHCARKAELRHFRHLIPDRATNIHLHAGACYARGLEVARKAYFVQGLSEKDAIKHGKHALSDMWGEPEIPEKSVKTLDRMLGALDFYFHRYPMKDDFIVPWVAETGEYAIEYKFAIPLPDLVHPETGGPIYFCGRTDMIGLYNGQLLVEDDKTTTSLGEKWSKNWTLDSQPTGYCWAAQQQGYPVVGAVIRGVSILSEKLDKDGNVNLDTSYGSAHAILQRPRWVIDRWLAEFQSDVEDMIRDYQRGHFRYALDKDVCNAYGGCPYAELCNHEDPEPWIKQYYKVDVWSPLHEIGIQEKSK